jgi:hypothetical protein
VTPPNVDIGERFGGIKAAAVSQRIAVFAA